MYGGVIKTFTKSRRILSPHEIEEDRPHEAPSAWYSAQSRAEYWKLDGHVGPRATDHMSRYAPPSTAPEG